ncbi:MAG: FAD/NAD(P)-binding protein [Chthoniobacterales bacterium]|nr:FAD/NAD(P)-binding protein [Chthoniobacterales bacterium]
MRQRHNRMTMGDIRSRAELSADVAILGGGASGTLLAIHLLRAASSPLQIVLLERKEKLGRGWAYGTPSWSRPVRWAWGSPPGPWAKS